ncbi:L-amino acid N-acyltransferase YncA [Aliiroseovarius halocynthiae]|uniref:GNAT family N-acetyltransferase n=1 Tax=Aliiroseovarius halocynthiae TaxID=985055 RepID=A0A545SNW6_9RHOB|nr:GNAT family N-acetyltransferase [Aliiroseovarius halocynthiae]TQV66556.1 GNAT family N-acetyltransferase [Aliiroseovarius halocynthiae]SMR82576.1 L-amino acid N-acyltransferase YncA [Aliiroseovarius halocynthiae]
MITTREATPDDAQAMSNLITPILEGWKSARRRDPDHMLANYIQNPDNIRCTVALDDAGRLVGFQSLILPSATNPYNTPEGWGEIGTYVALDAGRGGIGRVLFAASVQAAQAAGITTIEASIGDDNDNGLGFYSAIGFITYATEPGVIRKRFEVE